MSVTGFDPNSLIVVTDSLYQRRFTDLLRLQHANRLGRLPYVLEYLRRWRFHLLAFS